MLRKCLKCFVFAFNLCTTTLCENGDKIRWDFVFKMTLEQEIQVINVVCLSLIGKNLEKLYPSNLQIKWVDIFKWVQKPLYLYLTAYGLTKVTLYIFIHA